MTKTCKTYIVTKFCYTHRMFQRKISFFWSLWVMLHAVKNSLLNFIHILILTAHHNIKKGKTWYENLCEWIGAHRLIEWNIILLGILYLEGSHSIIVVAYHYTLVHIWKVIYSSSIHQNLMIPTWYGIVFVCETSCLGGLQYLLLLQVDDTLKLAGLPPTNPLFENTRKSLTRFISSSLSVEKIMKFRFQPCLWLSRMVNLFYENQTTMFLVTTKV